jgi:hypothetical protein
VIDERRVSIFVVIMLFSGHSTAATPPDCSNSKLSVNEWVQKYLESSATVFLGEVISMDSPQFDTPPSDIDDQIESKRSKPADAKSMAELLNLIKDLIQNVKFE